MNTFFQLTASNLIALISSYCISNFFIIYGFQLTKNNEVNVNLKPQNIHTQPTQRIGGIGVFIGIISAIFYWETDFSQTLFQLFIFGFLIFIIGLIEDIQSNLSVYNRLIAIVIISSIIVTINLIYINRVGSGFDELLSIKIISLIFTTFAITGLVNAYNIIDGLNGLSSFMALICLLSISLIASLNNDVILMNYSLICISSIFGFQLLNYPNGKIFLGDCGAYYIGYLCAIFSILLIVRNELISPFFVLIINIYPITETIYSIYRRFLIENKSYGAADRLHLHSLIFEKMKRGNSNKKNSNAIATLYIVIPTLAFVSISLVFYQSSLVLISLLVTYVFTYTLTYKKLYLARKISLADLTCKHF